MKIFKNNPKDLKSRDDLVREAHFQFQQKKISRRDFLRFSTALGGGALAMGLLPPMQRFQALAESRPVNWRAQGTTPVRGGTIYNALGVDTSAHFDDPATLNLVFASNAIRQVCDFLVVLDTTLTLQPSLATSWMPSADGMTWTVKLRENVKFNTGKTFSADDAVFTFTRLLDPKVASGWSGAANYVTGVEKVDDNTIAFHTNRVAADFIYSLFLYQAFILPSEWPGDFVNHPWGTGPFTMDSFTPGESIKFKARDDYWQMGADGKPLPYLDAVEFDFYKDNTASYNAAQEGSVDMAGADTTLKAQYTALTNYNFTTVQTANLDDIVMQFDQDPWTKPEMRQAMKLIIDRAAYVSTRFGGFAIEGNDQPIAPGLYALAPASVTPTAQDLDMVKSLLAKAGYSNGINITATYIDKASDGGYTDKFAQFLVSQTQGTGINLTLSPDPHYWDTWLNDWGPNHIGLSNWAQKNTASEMFNLAYYSKGIWNETHWVDANFDSMLKTFDSTLDEATRKTQLAGLMNEISTNGSVVIPGWRQDAAIIGKNIHYKVHPQAYVWFGDAWMDQSSS